MGLSGSKLAQDDGDRALVAGRPDLNRCDNMITTSKYTVWTFLPIAVGEQFRKFANSYFLLVGIIMAVGTWSDVYESAISPWTTLLPLTFVVSVSLLVEGAADKKRHKSDELTNNAPCTILRRGAEIDADEGATRAPNVLGGKDVKVNLSKAYFRTSNSQEPQTPVSKNKDALVSIGFQSVRRMDVRQGHLIVVKNREMVPADMILLASSGESGSAYIETSSIDGETNLKLRTSPHLPKKMLKHLRDGTPMDQIEESPENDETGELETIEQATKRITRFSCLAHPDGVSALKNPTYLNAGDAKESETSKRTLFSNMGNGKSPTSLRSPSSSPIEIGEPCHYVATLTSEPPNPHVNTFSGKLTLPPVEHAGECLDIALGADNILLRGAVLRNTEWAIGLSCFTGTDTKLVQNSFDTPSKFSQLDRLMNKTVVLVVVIMVLCISYLATMAVVKNDQEFDNLWYLGLNSNLTATWPYLPDDLDPPDWDDKTDNWWQMFFLYVTLLSNFVPLSMYVTVEAINFFFLYLIYVDKDMYDAKTDTRAVARSTNVTDLGQVQYIFSDKTGTLTQNVMRFKRCSVDGLVFGAPIARSRPGAEQDDPQSSFHPTRHLLVGRVGAKGNSVTSPDGELTFNSEMFLRVMSLCHTVVVEKDLDMSDDIDGTKSVNSQGSSISKKKKKMKTRDRTASNMSEGTNLEPLSEDGAIVGGIPDGIGSMRDGLRSRAASAGSLHVPTTMEQGTDGAPIGYAYQAESPDEGALVSAASASFGFQVVGRDAAGIKLRCAHPTVFSDEKLVQGIKSGAMSSRKLAVDSAAGTTPTKNVDNTEIDSYLSDPAMQRLETWRILAVNKFDSERKRMSILLRSPPELGNIPMLLCKGADSAMLDPNICTGAENLVSPKSESQARLGSVSENFADSGHDDEWETAQMLGIQSCLGEFASEGLRTLVLGIRFLTESQCENWMEQFKTAATSIKNREEMLKEAAYAIEKNIHIVGATAIEDKLQVGVPRTIATLEKAGIKLWVLTGDKRETAIEIGYSTHVLTSKMHLTEVADKGVDFVRAQCAMEFMRLVKQGKLPLYQRAAVDQSDDGWTWANASFAIGKFMRLLSRSFRGILAQIHLKIGKISGADPAVLRVQVERIKAEEEAEKDVLKDVVRRRNVRNRAEQIIQEFLNTPEGQQYSRRHRYPMSPNSDGSGEISLSSDDIPQVFGRAQSARMLLEKRKSEGKLGSTELRNVSLAQLTAQESERDQEQPLIDEDTLSLKSFLPISGDAVSDFDRRRRTVLERLFAVDRSVRKGKLVKHLKKDKRMEALSSAQPNHAVASTPASTEGSRALVIEGAALKYLLGDIHLEEVIFAIASKCDAVIACRVSPRQKALLVKLVRHHVVPEPVTLAIGDGANDVGMIQEAHVGVGISGKEGKQAVNASDFAIAQFRFLETLVLIHGRWSFFRLSSVVLFSFYKNAVMAGCLIVFNGRTLYSGTPLFDEWVIGVLNFVAGMPILLLGLFDRCLDKDYIRRNPEVYQPTRENELITFRVFIRWVLLTFGHVFCLYYGSIPQLAGAGGMSSAFKGLMRNEDTVGEGEGGDLQSVGQVTFTCLIIVLAYKILYESRSLIHGRFPAFTCRKDVKEGFWSRVPYTWYGVTYCSIVPFFIFLMIYQNIGARGGPGVYFNLVGVVFHVLRTRTVNWLVILFLPIAATAFDVAGKVFGNMFYPTQTQIHIEIEAKEIAAKKRVARETQEEGDTSTPTNGTGRV